MNKNSDAKLKANNKYRAKTYEQINLVVHKGVTDYYKQEMSKQGYKSLNGFIKDAIEEKIDRFDKSTTNQ